MEITFDYTMFLISWFLIEFAPFQNLIEAYGEWIEGLTNKFLTGMLTWIYELFTCLKCLTFWSTLIYTQEPLTAIFWSMVASTYQKIIN